jgi:hypothetical protein
MVEGVGAAAGQEQVSAARNDVQGRRGRWGGRRLRNGAWLTKVPLLAQARAGPFAKSVAVGLQGAPRYISIRAVCTCGGPGLGLG